MSHVTEINRIEDLESLRLTWSVLFQKTANASFFQTLDWLQAYWRHYGEGQRLRVLVVSAGGTPIGILPLTVVSEQTRVGRVRVLTYPLHDWGTFFGPIGPNPTATLTLAMRHIQATPRDWDLLDMRWVNRETDDRMRTQWAMERAGFSVREGVWKTTALIDLDCQWDDYWMSRTSKFRNNIRRSERRLEGMGEVEFIRYRPQAASHGDGQPRWDLFDACVEIAASSWQGSSTTGTTLSHDEIHEFLCETHQMAAKNGMLDLNLLTINKKPVAYSYNYHHQGNLTGLRMGYLPSTAKCGVGSVLLAKMLEDSCDRGDRCMDLGTGSLEIKQKWMTRETQSRRYTHYPLMAARAQLLRLKHLAVAHTSKAKQLAA